MKGKILLLFFIPLLSILYFFRPFTNVYGATVCSNTPNELNISNQFLQNNVYAGVPFPLVIYACNSSGQIDSTFNGNVQLTDSTTTLYPSSTTNFVDGVWSGQVTITRAINSDQITAYSSLYGNGISSSFNVLPSENGIIETIIQGSNQSGVVGSNLPQALSVTTTDQFGNIVSGVGVTFTIAPPPSGATGQSLSNYSAITNSSGSASTVMTLGTKEGIYIVTVQVSTGSSKTSSQYYEYASSGSLAVLNISPASAIVPQGGVINFQASGLDKYGNPVTISSPVWSISNGGGTIDQNGNFTAGQTTGMYYNTVSAAIGGIGTTATVNIISAQNGSGSGTGATSTPTPSPTPTPDYVTVTPTPTPTPDYVTLTPTPSPDPIDHVLINPNPVTVSQGESVSITATAYDANNNPLNGTFNWVISTGLGTLSSNYGSSVTLNAGNTPGNGTISVSALNSTGSKSDTVNVTIIPSPLAQKLLNDNIGGGHFYIKNIGNQTTNTPFLVIVMAEDNNNNIIKNFNSPIVIDDTTHTITPGSGTNFINGIWSGNEVITTPQNNDVVSVSGGGITGTSNEFNVTGKSPPNIFSTLSSKISSVIVQANSGTNSKFDSRIISAGLISGLGLLGSALSIGLMSSKGLEAIGRNPYARGKIQISMLISTVVCIGISIAGIVLSIVIK